MGNLEPWSFSGNQHDPRKYVSWIIDHSFGKFGGSKFDPKTIRSQAIKDATISLIKFTKDEFDTCTFS